jgi:ABC-type polysaccharide/polyol phosphate export permease
MVQNFLRRDLMARVNGSALGVGWILLQPLFMFAIYWLVFGFILKRAQEPSAQFALYMFTGVIVFHALNEATSTACAIVVDNGNLVKKVAFPAEVLLVHVSLVSVVLYVVSAVVALVAVLITGIGQPGWMLLTLPLVLLVQFVMTLGLGLLLANLHVFLRDTAQLWRLFAQTWMFLSPVFWATGDLKDKVPDEALAWLPVLNPAWPLIQVHRMVLGGSEADFGPFWPQLGYAAAWALGFLLVGYGLFMSRKHKYSDLI